MVNFTSGLHGVAIMEVGLKKKKQQNDLQKITKFRFVLTKTIVTTILQY